MSNDDDDNDDDENRCNQSAPTMERKEDKRISQID